MSRLKPKIIISQSPKGFLGLDESFAIEGLHIKNNYSMEVWMKKEKEKWNNISVIRDNGEFGLYVNGSLVNPKHRIRTLIWMKIKHWFNKVKRIF